MAGFAGIVALDSLAILLSGLIIGSKLYIRESGWKDSS
jgi:hypothetical protein